MKRLNVYAAKDSNFQRVEIYLTACLGSSRSGGGKGRKGERGQSGSRPSPRQRLDSYFRRNDVKIPLYPPLEKGEIRSDSANRPYLRVDGAASRIGVLRRVCEPLFCKRDCFFCSARHPEGCFS
jgi:hypothetical protein